MYFKDIDKTIEVYPECEKGDETKTPLPEVKKIKVGDRVISEKFGAGVIKRVYGKFYEVQFEGTKQITKDIKKVK